MSDGYHSGADFDTGSGGIYEPEKYMSPRDRRDVGRIDEALRETLPLAHVLGWLPQLGTTLWLHRDVRDQTFPRARMLQHGVLLLEHPALAAIADCTRVAACSAVTSHGPREWLVFADSHATVLAKLYLLPDTDYLAWDGMLAGCRIEQAAASDGQRRWQAHRAFMRGALSCLRSSWQARIVRFPAMSLPCLQVLGLRDADDVSALGKNIAAAIAHDERAG